MCLFFPPLYFVPQTFNFSAHNFFVCLCAHLCVYHISILPTLYFLLKSTLHYYSFLCCQTFLDFSHCRRVPLLVADSLLEKTLEDYSFLFNTSQKSQKSRGTEQEERSVANRKGCITNTLLLCSPAPIAAKDTPACQLCFSSEQYSPLLSNLPMQIRLFGCYKTISNRHRG